MVLRDDEVFDISEDVWTSSELFEADDPVAVIRRAKGKSLGSVNALVANSTADQHDEAQPWFLAACDL